jgi:hypothetical protein
MAQLTYAAKPPLAVQGMIADVGFDNVVMSRAAIAALHVGVGVQMAGNAPNPPGAGQVQELPDGAAGVGLFGISVYDSTRMPYTADANGKALYDATTVVPVLTRGRIWVWTEAATAATDPVYVRVLAAGANTKGQFINAATTNFIAVTTARWITSTTGAGLIQLELR